MAHPKDRTHGTLDVPMDRSRVSLYSFDWSNWKYTPRPAPNLAAQELLEKLRKKSSSVIWLSKKQCDRFKVPVDARARIFFKEAKDGWIAKITIDGKTFESSLMADQDSAFRALEPLWSAARNVLRKRGAA